MTGNPSLIESENAYDSGVHGDEPVYHILGHAQDESYGKNGAAWY